MRVEYTCPVCHMDWTEAEMIGNVCPSCRGEMAAVITNCTPHPVTVLGENRGLGGWSITFPPSGIVARVSTEAADVGGIRGIPLVRRSFGPVVDLPPSVAGQYLLVSSMVASACPDRPDLVVPGELVRDDAGTIIGCWGLARLA